MEKKKKKGGRKRYRFSFEIPIMAALGKTCIISSRFITLFLSYSYQLYLPASLSSLSLPFELCLALIKDIEEPFALRFVPIRVV